MAGSEKRAYLLVYSDSISRGEVKICVKSMDSVLVWRHDLPNSFYLISRSTADEISDEFREAFGSQHGRFILVEITKNKQGWLPKETWYLLNNKELDRKD